ncbi:anterior gradient protein 3-like [Scleropages formosus]|uniref:Anterior gradient 1 n=1 Tax=Scleropages formosus TaxID=113540 RepID=A0A8C9S0E8_SCLFO|nr:anterior gradient protein 3-like [Scleropages formosus]
MSVQSLLCVMLLVTVLECAAQKKARKPPQTLSRGWGDEITWVQTYEEGLTKMKQSQKPLMVIHHKEDCPYSQALKKAFAADKAVQKMAQEDFVMLNVVHETWDKHLASDGTYVPRIVFVDPSMKVRVDIVGKYGNRLYAYQADNVDTLLNNMKKAKVLLHNEL